MTLLKTRATSLVLIALVLLGGFFLGRSCAPEGSSSADSGDGSSAEASAEPEVWTCSMHPQIRQPEPGKCPICFMDLIPATSGDDDGGPRTLVMGENAMALAEIETAVVERRGVAHEIEMVGKVAIDETRLSYITSWVPGRLDRLFVDYTGVSVRGGDHLAKIYSPTLYSAQQELLQAIETAKRLEKSSLEVLKTTTDRTVHSAREKLRLYGLNEEQILSIVDGGKPTEHVTLYAPKTGGVVIHKHALEGMYVKEGTPIYTIADLSKVWVQLDAYESDLAWVRYGQDVKFRVEAYPGEEFHGRVAFIDPVLDDRTRTIKVRLNVDNSALRLKPEMFVSAATEARLSPSGAVVDEQLVGKWMCPMHPEVIADGPDACTECGMDLVSVEELGFSDPGAEQLSLVIPRTAPLVTGRRAVVYVRVPGAERPTFEGRVVELGPRAGDWYVVISGVEEGERVVVSGNFKIDSELQIRTKLSMMNPGEEPVIEPPPPTPVAAPETFRASLGEVVAAYLNLQRAFAGDEDSQAMAQLILDRVRGVDMGALEGEAHMRWMELLPALEEAAAEVAGAADLEGRRVLLEPLTSHLVTALDSFGYQMKDGPVGLFHCPMALDGEGGDWLQLGEQTANPYYGSMMLRCGSRTRLLEEEL